VVNAVETHKIDYVYGTGSLLEAKTPFFPWRTVFEQLTGIESTLFVHGVERS